MITQPKNRELAIFLNLTEGFGSRSFKKALDMFQPFEDILEADQSGLARLGLPPAAVSSIMGGDPKSLAAAEEEKADRFGARVATYFDEEYPAMLKYIHDPPPVLYVKGPLNIRQPGSVAVVGSRHPTPYGIRTAETIGRELAQAGFNVVSGMARGIDTAVHRGALAAQGSTTAVYGCGLDTIYPPENRPLADKISATGACLSEFPLGLQPDRYTFPRRNRIISGLSLAVVVVEAAEKSGALITADHALEQGKEVFAVPGPIGSGKSSGCHRLIKEGARLFENIEELAGELKPLLKQTPISSAEGDHHSPRDDLTPEEKSLLTFIRDEPVFMDEVINHFGLPAESAASLMLSLELKGCIRQFPGKRFIRDTGAL